MTTVFYEVSSFWQILALVFSQLTVIALAVGCIVVFRHGYSVQKQLGMGAALLLNVVLYVLMQLGSRITEGEQALWLNIPYTLLLLSVLLSLVCALRAVLLETKNRKTINRTSIREAFDNLPAGVCFFNEAGLPVLCNRAMQRFSFSVCGRDVQFISDLHSCLSEAFVPVDGTIKDGKIFILPDGSAKNLEEWEFVYEDGTAYTQYIVQDVTDLQKNREELQRENAHLRKVQADLARLSANMVTITREEEILNTKMRVHDEMARCLLAAHRYLEKDDMENIPNDVVLSWQRAVSMLKYNNDVPDEDMLLQIRRTCEVLDLSFIQTGALPQEEQSAYILTCAVRECVTNAVRYAEATELYVDFSETDVLASVTVTNNGTPPSGEIVEGGGLSTLRRRVEREGGDMRIQSTPQFKLIVTIPKKEESLL